MTNRATSARVDRSVASTRLVEGLGDWSGGTGPLYRQLARAIAAAVERGEHPRGSRLPAERALATAIAVSRGVVVAAYDQMVLDGVIERRRGSGTYVAGTAAVDLPSGREGPQLVARLVDAGSSPAVIDLSLSVLRTTALLPNIVVGSAALETVGTDSPWGLPELRTRVAERLGQVGLEARASEVLITTGAQQGISVAAGCWVRPGDTVVVDDPTYPGALAALAAAGARLRPVPVDHHGPKLDLLEAALDDRPSLVYLQSGPHSPTGGRISVHRRRAIAKMIKQSQVPLIEDVALYGLDWSHGPMFGPVAAEIPDHPVALVGSYSKLFGAGLRVGFVRAPEPVARRLVRVKATHDLGSSTISQAMALALLDHPDHDRVMVDLNRELADRSALLVRLLKRELPTWQSKAPDGGLSLWVRLPYPVASRFAEISLRHGVAVATADSLSCTADHLDRLRLTFAVAKPDLRLGVRRLSAAWAELS